MNNNLKVNAEKLHLFLSLHEHETITVENYAIKSSGVEEFLGVTTVENYAIKSRGVEELLGVTIDSNLNSKEHILSLCKKACSVSCSSIYDLE